jgi:hypothetical protein
MTVKAYTEMDLLGRGVDVTVGEEHNDGSGWYVRWGEVSSAPFDPQTEPPREARLRLKEDVARAIYEALGDHFGHAGHDARALRKDYEAERKRVDTLIAHLAAGTR